MVVVYVRCLAVVCLTELSNKFGRENKASWECTTTRIRASAQASRTYKYRMAVHHQTSVAVKRSRRDRRVRAIVVHALSQQRAMSSASLTCLGYLQTCMDG